MMPTHSRVSTTTATGAMVVLCVLLLPSAVQACGPGEQQVFACTTTKNKVVEVCNAGSNARYTYGRRNAKPELSLLQPKSKLRYQRESGSGGGSEHLTFRNGNTSYQVISWVTFDRTYGDGRTTQFGETGEITVSADDRQIANIACRDETVASDFNILGMEPWRAW